jgi:leader peptidase (prepilin peptidase)/N-methyltransferase
MSTAILIGFYLIYTAVLCYVSWTDIQTRRIPNNVIIPAIAVALFATLLTGNANDALFGAVIGPLPLVISRWISGAGQVGMGDIKLAFFIGLILGYPLVLYGVTTSLVLSLLVGAIGIVQGKYTLRSKLPFGPFLAVGALAMMVVALLPKVG